MLGTVLTSYVLPFDFVLNYLEIRKGFTLLEYSATLVLQVTT